MAKGGGGAWKVAYADFITAMMALFMVLWILGSEQELLEHMQEYFRNPPSPWDRQSGKYMVEIGEYEGIVDEGKQQDAYFNETNPSVFKGLIQSFNQMMDVDKSTATPPVEMVLTSDGLRVIIFDRMDSPLFEEKETELTEWGDFLIQNLAWLLSRYAFDVVIEGHGDGRDVERKSLALKYGPWELSTDRANMVRRKLEFYAGGELGISRVIGYGNTQPLEGGESDDRTNQRITLSLSLPNPSQTPPVLTGSALTHVP